MANVIIPQRFWLRRGLAAALTAANELLYAGEVCCETDTGRAKIGDGITDWNSLGYAVPGRINLSGLADGQVLVWDLAADEWVADSVMVNPLTDEWDLLVGGVAGAPDRLPVGADGTFLGVVAGALTYLTAPAPDAVDVPIADAGGYFTSTDVEGALQELGAASGSGGGGGTYRRNFLTIGAQSAPSQAGFLLVNQGTILQNNTCASTNIVTSLPRVFYRTAAAANALGGFYNSNAASIWRGNAAGRGGFDLKITWAAGEGVTNTSCRCFVGINDAGGGSTDVNPSTITNMVGMGWDSTDTNIQIMHNDASGTATKVDLGASFPVPVVDLTEAYSIILRCDPNGSSIDWEVTRLSTNVTAIGTISTDMPANTVFMGPRGYISAGGVSTQTSIGIMYLGWEPGQ